MPREHLIIFTRYPIAGKAKTRLIPALGEQGAADTQRSLTELTLCRAMALAIARGVSLEVRYEGGDERTMREWLGHKPRYTPQGDGDLGQRLARATDSAFESKADAVMIIGADCPRLDEQILTQAFESLVDDDVVFGPALDGGYYLIGLRKPLPAVFEGIAWSTSRALSDSVARAREYGHEPTMLASLPDVDEPTDLADWHELQARQQTVSVVIPTLNEAAHLAETLSHVLAASPYEVVVADGGSVDATLDIADRAGVKVIRSDRGRGTQMNAGAASATGELLLFLHADTLPPPEYPSLIAQTLRHPQQLMGAFRFGFREPAPPCAAIIERLTALRCRWLHRPYGDQGFFIRRSLFNTIQGFCDWPILEDLELVNRLRPHGHIVHREECIRTSGQRWQSQGIMRTFLQHQAILMGSALGLRPERLATWR